MLYILELGSCAAHLSGHFSTQTLMGVLGIVGWGQLIAGSQFGQGLALGEGGERYLGFEAGRVATAGAFGDISELS